MFITLILYVAPLNLRVTSKPSHFLGIQGLILKPRPPLSRGLGLAAVEVTPERLTRLVRRLAAETNRAHLWAIESGQLEPPRAAAPDVVRASDSAHAPSARPLRGAPRRIARRPLAAAPRRARRRRPAGRRLRQRAAGNGVGIPVSTPKSPRLLGWVLPRLGISGFYNPYAAEATVAAGLPDPSFVFVMAHEMAHQRGVASEDEANFLAFLACRESGLAAADYAGALGAFNLAYNGLWRAAPDSVRALGSALLDPGPRADRRAIRAWWDLRRSRLEPTMSAPTTPTSRRAATDSASPRTARPSVSFSRGRNGGGGRRTDHSRAGPFLNPTISVATKTGPSRQSRRAGPHLLAGDSTGAGRPAPRMEAVRRESEGADRTVRNVDVHPEDDHPTGREIMKRVLCVMLVLAATAAAVAPVMAQGEMKLGLGYFRPEAPIGGRAWINDKMAVDFGVRLRQQGSHLLRPAEGER